MHNVERTFLVSLLSNHHLECWDCNKHIKAKLVRINVALTMYSHYAMYTYIIVLVRVEALLFNRKVYFLYSMEIAFNLLTLSC